MGPEGPMGPPGDKMAIVPWRDQFVGLFCVESPDVRFEDVLRVVVTGHTTIVPLDPVFREVCEPGSIEVISACSPIPTPLGAEVIQDQLHIRIAGDLPSYVTVKLSGIRQGRRGVRFPRHTRSEMERNNRFWSQARRG